MNFESTESEVCVKELAPDGMVEYHDRWLEPAQADACMDALIEEIEWERRWITMFGKRIMQPRLVAFQGDPGVRYTYSADVHAARGWDPTVASLRDRLEEGCGLRFNSVLLNLYRDGSDAMGWHADDERELGNNPSIASISLGATRRFVLRSKADRTTRFELEPAHGSLIVMRGALQHHWQHQVPRTRNSVGPRVNLTFRRVLDLRSRRDSPKR
jgi:alkylated DNA repair dioxygenase AlkB